LAEPGDRGSLLAAFNKFRVLRGEAHRLLVAKLRFATRAPKLKLKLLKIMSGGRWPRKLELL
jgi:hypothetical protein